MNIRHSYADNDRRFKIAYIHSHVLLNCLVNNQRGANDTVSKVSLDVPEGTVVVDRYYDFARAAEGIVLYHKDWESIPLGYELPQIYLQHSYVTVDLSQSNTKTTQPIRNKYPAGHFINKEQAMSGVPSPIDMKTTIRYEDTGKVEVHKDELNIKFINESPSLHFQHDPDKQQTIITDVHGNQAIVKDSERKANMHLEKEFYKQVMGVPHETWRDKKPLL